MLNINGKCGVYKVENKGKYVVCSLRTAKKDKEGNWQSMFYNAKFVGRSFELAKTLQNKDKIEITSAVLENRSYEKDGVTKQYMEVVIFEFQLDGQPVKKYEVENTVEDDNDIPF